MDVLTHLTAQVEELQERYFLSDEEVIRMIVGGSLVASIILGIAYMVYITNFTIVLSYIRSKILVSLVPKITKENAFIPIIVYVQVFIFVVSCLFFRRVKTIHMLDNYGPAISSGQVYRFFTSALVHSDLFSLFNNARAFGSIGGLLEQSIGIKVVILFLASNTIHAVISFLINPLDHSFGGHGVAFAFIGAAMYINFFRSSLFIHGEQKAQERKDQAQDLIRDESLIFFARYVLIGVFMDRMDLMTSVLSLIVGFITCMALCGDLAGNKTRTVVAVYVVITSLLIGYTQLYEIQNLDAELKKLQVCYKVSSEKRYVNEPMCTNSIVLFSFRIHTLIQVITTQSVTMRMMCNDMYCRCGITV
jgi:membrane associated rhomboid family serine protease